VISGAPEVDQLGREYRIVSVTGPGETVAGEVAPPTADRDSILSYSQRVWDGDTPGIRLEVREVAGWSRARPELHLLGQDR
jgi:hypothetical protein